MAIPGRSDFQTIYTLVTAAVPVIAQSVEVILKARELLRAPTGENRRMLRESMDVFAAAYMAFDAELRNARNQLQSGRADSIKAELLQFGNIIQEKFNSVYATALLTISKWEALARHDPGAVQLPRQLRARLEQINETWLTLVTVLMSDQPDADKADALGGFLDSLRGFHEAIEGMGNAALAIAGHDA